jgi:hypothetical protein
MADGFIRCEARAHLADERKDEIDVRVGTPPIERRFIDVNR